MIVVDTNVVSELMRPKPDRGVVVWLDTQDPTDIYLTAITVAELTYGVARLPQGRRKSEIAEQLEALLDQDFSARILAFDDVAARHYGAIVAERDRSGTPISMADAQIAAVCVTSSSLYGASPADHAYDDEHDGRERRDHAHACCPIGSALRVATEVGHDNSVERCGSNGFRGVLLNERIVWIRLAEDLRQCIPISDVCRSDLSLYFGAPFAACVSPIESR